MQPTLILFGMGALVVATVIAIARLFAMSDDRFRRADAAMKAFWAAVGRVFSVVMLVDDPMEESRRLWVITTRPAHKRSH